MVIYAHSTTLARYITADDAVLQHYLAIAARGHYPPANYRRCVITDQASFKLSRVFPAIDVNAATRTENPHPIAPDYAVP